MLHYCARLFLLCLRSPTLAYLRGSLRESWRHDSCVLFMRALSAPDPLHREASVARQSSLSSAAIDQAQREKNEREKKSEREGDRGGGAVNVRLQFIRAASGYSLATFYLCRDLPPHETHPRIAGPRAMQRMADNNFSLRQVKRESRGHRFIFFRFEFLTVKLPLPRVKFFLRNANHV